jgi:hypothetical protein
MDITPFNGQSPEPNSMPFEPMDRETIVNVDDFGNPEPQAPAAPEVQVAPAPQDPDLAAQMAELRQQVGSLVNAMGERNATVRELELQLELAKAGAGRPAPVIPQLPQGVNPDHPLTIGEFHNVYFGQLLPQQQAVAAAQAIRAGWDVTPEEEYAVIQTYPNLPTQEPDRTRFIAKAATLRRPPTPAKAASATPSASAPTRPAPPVVPHVEASTPSVGSAQPSNAAAQLRARYEAAKQIEDPKKRETAMRDAAQAIERALGITDETYRTSKFTMSS